MLQPIYSFCYLLHLLFCSITTQLKGFRLQKLHLTLYIISTNALFRCIYVDFLYLLIHFWSKKRLFICDPYFHWWNSIFVWNNSVREFFLRLYNSVNFSAINIQFFLWSCCRIRNCFLNDQLVKSGKNSKSESFWNW